jgi:hypothetical protein
MSLDDDDQNVEVPLAGVVAKQVRKAFGPPEDEQPSVLGHVFAKMISAILGGAILPGIGVGLYYFSMTSVFFRVFLIVFVTFFVLLMIWVAIESIKRNTQEAELRAKRRRMMQDRS